MVILVRMLGVCMCRDNIFNLLKSYARKTINFEYIVDNQMVGGEITITDVWIDNLGYVNILGDEGISWQIITPETLKIELIDSNPKRPDWITESEWNKI